MPEQPDVTTIDSEWASATTLGELLTLEEIDTNIYRARNPADRPESTLFGGQVAAQALRAAASTVPDGRVPHSLHGYFLRPGRGDLPTLLVVDRDRDGRSFSARHVNAVQQGEVIFSALASFHLETDGPDMQIEDAPVDMGVPDSLPVRGRGRHELLLDVRDGSTDDPGYVGSRFWVRSRSALADDPVTRACVLTFVSDLGYGLDSVAPAAEYFGPSLDHAVWLHRTVDVNDWMFVELRPRTLAGSRGVFTGTVHDAAGTLAAYLAQEALLRGPR